MIYAGIGPNTGKAVDEDEARDYAMSHCGIEMQDPNAPDADEFAKMFVEWYFSGNWMEVRQ